MFHVHIDGHNRPEALVTQALGLGFKLADFLGGPEPEIYGPQQSFEPPSHLTWKGETRDALHQVWGEISAACHQHHFVGYLEGEFIREKVSITERPFTDVPVPFQLTRRRLTGGRGEEFRETEMHVVLDSRASDRRLIQRLLDAGLYGAYYDKPTGYRAMILTAQGFVRDVRPLMGTLIAYLEAAGGSVRGTIKEECIARYELFGIAAPDLPEIIANVKML